MPDPRDELLRYLDGELDAEERRVFEQTLLDSSDRMLEAYDELMIGDLLRRGEVRSRRRRRSRTSKARPMRVVAATAAIVIAAVGLLVFAIRFLVPSPVVGPTNAGPTTASLVAFEPRGTQERLPERFAWSSDPSADRYYFELLDLQGRRVMVRSVTDTVLVVTGTDDMPLAATWRVQSLDELGQERRDSGLVPYRVKVTHEMSGR